MASLSALTGGATGAVGGAIAREPARRCWDDIVRHSQARRCGFDGWDDSEERFSAILDQYLQARILP